MEQETGRCADGISQKKYTKEIDLHKYGRKLLITITDWNVTRILDKQILHYRAGLCHNTDRNPHG
jgi:hypothetical protein